MSREDREGSSLATWRQIESLCDVHQFCAPRTGCSGLQRRECWKQKMGTPALLAGTVLLTSVFYYLSSWLRLLPPSSSDPGGSRRLPSPSLLGSPSPSLHSHLPPEIIYPPGPRGCTAMFYQTVRKLVNSHGFSHIPSKTIKRGNTA